MDNLDVEVLDTELIRVCLTEDGITECCFVTSFHLIQEKERQLRRGIMRQAQEAFQDD
jgi:hypothetical protein